MKNQIKLKMPDVQLHLQLSMLAAKKKSNLQAEQR